MGATLNLTVKNVPNSTNISANTSKVDITLSITTDGGTTNLVGDTQGSITLNGSKIANLEGKKVYKDKTTELYSGRHTVKHSSDGKGKAEVKASFDVNTSTRWIYANKTVTLSAIPRASKLGDLSSFVIEDRISVPVTKYSSAFTDTLAIIVNGHTIRTKVDYTSGYQIGLYPEEILAAYKYMSQSKNSDTFTFKLTTKDSSGKVVGTDSKTATGYARGEVRSGTNKRGIVWRNCSGTWQRCVIFLNVDGTWHRGR